MGSSRSSGGLHLGMPWVSRDTASPSQLLPAPLAKGRALPMAGSLQPGDKSGFASLVGGFCLCCGRVFPPLNHSKLHSGMLMPHYQKRWKSSKSQTGEPSGAEWDERGRLEPHPALQIPEGEPKGKTCSSLRAWQVLTWPMKPHQTPTITD